MNTPFFQFLLYILLVILTYFLVRNISKKVYESFDNHRLPPVIRISGKLEKNNLQVYFLLPENLNGATDIKLTLNSREDTTIFYKIKDLTMENSIYKLTIENLEYDQLSKIYVELMSEWGIGKPSNILNVKPVKEVVMENKQEEINTNKPQKYVSCHPDGTYTIHKNYIINPPLINNLKPSLLKKLQEVLKPKEKTYDVEINLE